MIYIFFPLLYTNLKTSLVAQTVKRLSTMRETRVPSLGWENPPEKELAIHSRTIAWEIPWTEEPGSDFTSYQFKRRFLFKYCVAIMTPGSTEVNYSQTLS